MTTSTRSRTLTLPQEQKRRSLWERVSAREAATTNPLTPRSPPAVTTPTRGRTLALPQEQERQSVWERVSAREAATTNPLTPRTPGALQQ